VTALLDASVLYSAPLRDLLMHLAVGGLYAARWTDRIHDEWTRSLLQNRPDRTRARLQRTRDLMNSALLDSLISGYEELIPRLRLPDPNDRHVLAAAIHAGADLILTMNLRHFPVRTLAASHHSSTSGRLRRPSAQHGAGLDLFCAQGTPGGTEEPAKDGAGIPRNVAASIAPADHRGPA